MLYISNNSREGSIYYNVSVVVYSLDSKGVKILHKHPLGFIRQTGSTRYLGTSCI